MTNGRTAPLLFAAEDEHGNLFDVVVKLRGREINSKGQIAELVSAQLADELGIAAAQASIVTIPDGFDEVVPQEYSMAIRSSMGPNFGSVHLGTGFTTWPTGRSPIGGQRDQAASIFAFDYLIQNPDRRSENPNLWSTSDKLGVYDHEQAFSFLFLLIFGGIPRPWILADQNKMAFMSRHIFYHNLKSGRLNLDPIECCLASLSDHVIDSFFAPVPYKWSVGHSLCSDLASYLREARESRVSFINCVKHYLR